MENKLFKNIYLKIAYLNNKQLAVIVGRLRAPLLGVSSLPHEREVSQSRLQLFFQLNNVPSLINISDCWLFFFSFLFPKFGKFDFFDLKVYAQTQKQINSNRSRVFIVFINALLIYISLSYLSYFNYCNTLKLGTLSIGKKNKIKLKRLILINCKR
ncbi:hypothetical protein BpHYR1_009706 [Brachionus plicatilis]|uniref:Uncharacterized protein n=1 Tax=Brachionus plicatilis TaxID=10195 RepID=A0A3M7P0P5_BRAPC|nr:hypothetical protein BpHYR1_009706 [Brachionus plicatilis]